MKHPRIAEIESALWKGWEEMEVVRYFRLPTQPLYHHWTKHMRHRKARFVDIGLVEGAPPEMSEEDVALAALGSIPGADVGVDGESWPDDDNPPEEEVAPDIVGPVAITLPAEPTTTEPVAMVPSDGLYELKPARRLTLEQKCKKASDDPKMQVNFLSYLLDSGKFYFGHTLEWARGIWKITPVQMKARFDAAVKRCSGYRQSVVAQTIASLSAIEQIEREAMSAWYRSRRDKTEKPQFLAIARAARKDFAYVAGLGHQNLRIDQNVWVRPDFVNAVDQLTETVLDTLSPTEDSAFHALVSMVESTLGKRVEPGVVAAVLEAASEVMAKKLAVLAKKSSDEVEGGVVEMEELPPPSERVLETSAETEDAPALMQAG